MRLPAAVLEGFKLFAIFGAVAIVVWTMPEDFESPPQSEFSKITVDQPIVSR